MKLSEVVDTLEAKVFTGQDRLDTEILKAGSSDLMSDILAAMSDGGVLLTGLTTLQTINTAVISGISAIVFVRDKEPDSSVVALADKLGIPLLSTPYSMFVSSGRLYAGGLTGLSGAR